MHTNGRLMTVCGRGVILAFAAASLIGEPATGAPAAARSTASDRDMFKSLIKQQGAIASIEYTEIRSILVNGVLKEEGRRRMVESRTKGLMRSASLVVRPDGSYSPPLIMVYDEKAATGYYIEGTKRARAAEDDVGRMATSLRAIRDLDTADRYDVFSITSPSESPGDVAVFARYDLTRNPGLWSTVWVGSQNGLLLRTVEYSPMGLLAVTVLRDIKLNEDIPKEVFYEGVGEDAALPVQSLMEFMDTPPVP